MTHIPSDKTLLLVDDSEDLRLGTRLVLEHIGYHILEACSGEEALEITQGFCNTIDLLICDLHLDGMNGIDLCQRLHISMPKLKMILISGDSVIPDPNALHSVFLQKPFLPVKLLEEVDKLLS